MKAGFGSDSFSRYLLRREHWQHLRQQYETQGEQLVLYSCRHGYAHRAHVIYDLPPKVVAAAMGHSVQTHLVAYSRWRGDNWRMTPSPRQNNGWARVFALRALSRSSARPARTCSTLVPPGLPGTHQLSWVGS